MKKDFTIHSICFYLVSILFILGPSITLNGQEKVYFNLDKMTEIGVSDFSSFEILDSPDYLLGGIQNIRLIPEIGCLITSSNVLYLYDFKSNSITVKYSRIGRAENEYSGINDFGYENGMVYIFDMNTKRVLWFTIDGEYDHSTTVSEKASSSPFCYIKTLNDKYTIGRRVYEGMETTALSLYDPTSLSFIKEISPEIVINSGITFNNPFYKGSDKDILYLKYFHYDIYSITGENIRIKYNIDFGKYTFPHPEKYSDEYEIINELNNSGKKKYATLLTNIYEDKENLSFMFIMSEAKACLASYDKKQQRTNIWNISEPDYIVLQIVPTEDLTYVFMEDLDGELYVGKFINK